MPSFKHDKEFAFYLGGVEIDEDTFAEIASLNYKEDEDDDVMKIGNYEKERLIEMFEVVGQAADHCLWLLREFNIEIDGTSAVDSIYPRIGRIENTIEEICDTMYELENF